ncbi:MAG: hypothetical protein DBY36_03035 [Clostridiales bacterium]|nr:MAG: hypothetical protein DBY36_03035 [Clostridiales bacterium]
MSLMLFFYGAAPSVCRRYHLYRGRMPETERIYYTTYAARLEHRAAVFLAGTRGKRGRTLRFRPYGRAEAVLPPRGGRRLSDRLSKA